jgi:hypothetical protein
MFSVHLVRELRRRWASLPALVLAIPLVPAFLEAADTPNEPPFFAIQNARLVTGAGQVILLRLVGLQDGGLRRHPL